MKMEVWNWLAKLIVCYQQVQFMERDSCKSLREGNVEVSTVNKFDLLKNPGFIFT